VLRARLPPPAGKAAAPTAFTDEYDGCTATLLCGMTAVVPCGGIAAHV
jgi:hypothetical protein